MNRDGTQLCHYCGEYSSSPKCKSCENEEKRIANEELTRIVKRIEDQICFDALADSDGRCGNHGGKCYELRLLVNSLIKGE